MKFTCGRRLDSFHPLSKAGEDTWQKRLDGFRHCSYCGSLHPDDMFNLLDKGCTVGPTDKSYKIYVEGSLAAPHGMVKFYFQHFFDYAEGRGVLTKDYADRFMGLWREKGARLFTGGEGFYVRPMFLKASTSKP